MTKISWKSLIAASAFLSATVATSAQAQDATMAQVNQYAAEGAAMGQVTSVSQLRDVRPTDWAFQALQSLVERYGCIAGYPDGTFRGSRAMTRFEFAAGLNACLDRVNELIASATADMVTAEDLAVLQRLQEEFQAELATLRGRVDALEARTAELEANQFSTTTKLQGEAIFDLGGVFAGELNDAIALGTFDADDNFTQGTDPDTGLPLFADSEAEDDITFGGRIRLALNTSFTGKDLLRTRLQAGRMGNYETRFEQGDPRGGSVSVPEAAIAWNGDSNDVVMDELYYNFPVGKASVYVGTHGLDADDVVPTLGIFADSTLLDFFEDNQLSYDVGDSGAGAAVSYQLTDSLNLTGGYFTGTDTAASPGDDLGFFGGSNKYFGQLTFEASDRFVVAGTYTRSYNAGVADSYSTGNAFGLNAGYALSPKLTLSGWAGWADFDGKNGGADGELVNWAAILGLPDLFREGNYGSIAVGEFANNDDWFDNLAVQAIYKMQLSDNISIQPGVAWISQPLGDGDNDSVFIGNVRTVFSF
ncbi:MAG: iron uptake porin [Synechococcales cyanobacterium RM1_1_8]|nr:iron uptake porin [Synechococcales cyanobacterium RM1_1_8]